MIKTFTDYCNYVGKITAHLSYAYNNNLLSDDGCKARRGYTHIEETLDFCDSFEDLKAQLPLETFTEEYGDLEVFKPLIRKLNGLQQAQK